MAATPYVQGRFFDIRGSYIKPWMLNHQQRIARAEKKIFLVHGKCSEERVQKNIVHSPSVFFFNWRIIVLQCCIVFCHVNLLVAQSCPVLCNPMECSPPGSSVHGILQARILEWVATSFSRGSSLPRDRTQVSCITGKCFTA